MGRLYDAYVEVGPRFTGFGDIKKQGDAAGKQYGEALAKAAAKAAEANVRRLGEALAKARSSEADAAGKVRVAEAKLNEVRADSTAKASQLAAAEESLAAAQRKSATAADTAKTASESLDKARDQVAKSADGVGAKTGNRFSDAFKRVMSKRAEKDGSAVSTRFGLGFNGAFGGIVSRSAGLFVAGFAAIKGAQIFSGFIKDAAESEKIARITANAIKATGGAAHISADQVGELATSISNKTAIDDEQVQTAANMLLTFKNIRNEAGKGNDVFNQATQAAADLSVQFGGIDGASKQLGKALNDPIKGTTALAKAGVTFTDQQKKQIETLVKSGDVLGAQKIILKEIEGQVGGAAAAAADPMARLSVIGGNLAEKFGGVLLPTVNRFAGFLSDKAAPALGALLEKADAFTKSKGFQDFLASVESGAKAAFGFFRDEVLPRLQDFAGFITGTVAPAVATFGQNLANSLAPALKSVFGFFKDEVLPRLKDFAGFLGESVLPKLGSLLTSLSKNKDFLVPFAATIVTIIAALKAWAIVQGILNVVLAANPIGLVVVAIAALVAGLIWAYKNSETFRKIVNGAFDAVRTVIGLWWNYYVKPIFTALYAAFKFAWEQAKKFADLVKAAFDAIKEPARVAIKFVVDTFLGMVEAIITGAAKAFGWVPGLGDKLKGAADAFGKFRDDVNKKLSGISDQAVNIAIKYSSTGVNLTTPSSVGRRADGGPGGPVRGPGTTTSDSAGLYALSNKEWVVKASSSMKYGDQAMASVNAGTATIIPGFAQGGRPGLSVNTSGDSTGLAKAVGSAVVSMATAVAKQLAKAGGGLAGTMAFGRSQAGKPYVWGGVGPNGYDCSGFVSALINYARGRNPHSRLGATGSMPWSDFAAGPGRFTVGWFKGNPGHTAATINGVNFESRGGRGVVTGSGARGAYDSLFTNRMHVKGFAAGGRPGMGGEPPFDLLNPRGKGFLGLDLAKALGIRKYDTGGPWPPGTFGYNGTGKTETVRTAEQEAAIGGPLQVRVFIGNEEFRGYIRTEVDEANADLARSFNI